MEREIMPDHGTEAFYRYLIPEHVFGGQEEIEKGADRCCSPGPTMEMNLLDLSKGVSVEEVSKQFFSR